MKNLLVEAAKRHTTSPAVKGEWYKVSLIPDPCSGDRLNVGVVLKTRHKQWHYRFLTYFNRLRCLYGDDIEEQVRFLLQIVRGDLMRGVERPSPPSRNIVYQGPFHASGNSVDEILNTLFSTVVPLGKAPETQVERNESAFKSITNKKARSLVYQCLDTIIGLDSHHIIAETESLEIKASGKNHHLDIPLRPKNQYGSIVSACYKSPAAIERYLMRADLDIMTGQHIKPVTGQAGIFVLRPHKDMQLTSREMETLDNALDEILWKIRPKNYFIEVNDDPMKLAENILEWTH